MSSNVPVVVPVVVPGSGAAIALGTARSAPPMGGADLHGLPASARSAPPMGGTSFVRSPSRRAVPPRAGDVPERTSRFRAGLFNLEALNRTRFRPGPALLG